MGIPYLKIGGITVLGGAYAPHQWPKTLGLQAPRVVWWLPVDDATRLLAGPQETTIESVDSFGRKKTIRRVYVVGEEGSPDAKVRGVILTDVRFYLPFGWVRASYNVTIQSGTGRQTQADGIVNPNALPKVANVIFLPTSLRGSDDGPVGIPFNSKEVALDVLDKATNGGVTGKSYGHEFRAITVRDLSRPRATFVPNNVYVDHPGDVAVGSVLGALGGLDVRVADDGALELVDAWLGAEKKTVEQVVRRWFGAAPEGSLERLGKVRLISMANVAPASGKVLYTRRCEVRADSWEPEPAARYSKGDALSWGKTNDPVMTCVARVTDQQLVVPGSVPANLGGGTTAIQGVLLPMDALIDAVAALNDQPPGRGTPQLSRQFLLAGKGGNPSSSAILGGKLGFLYVSDGGTGTGANVLWGARLAEIVSSLRQLYKLSPSFSRLCKPGTIRAERAALLDAVTATRQPATPFFDIVQRPKNPGLATDDHWGWQLNNVPPSSPNTQVFPSGTKTYGDSAFPSQPFRLTGATAAQFNVSCEDQTLGVFRFTPTVQDTSKLSHEAMNIPGLVWGVPAINGSLNRIALLSYWEQAKQLLTHRVALVFSAVPAGQNNELSLHSYRVQVSEALARLGVPADAVQARGPVRELRVREGVAEARIPWDDDLREQILGCFAQTGTAVPQTPDGKGLIPVNDQELRDFAVSVFSVYMACVLDHYEGTMTLPFTPDVEPIGALRGVTHTFLPDGRIYSVLRCDGVVPAISPESLISQASRNVLFRGIS